MNAILQEIIAEKLKDLREKKKRLPFEELRMQIKERNSGGGFYRAVTEVANKPVIIGEVKFASPSAGDLGAEKDLLARVKQYEAAGIDAVSIITEPHFFNGSIDFIRKVKEVVALPVLQKDFMIDKYQIYESLFAGSDALLLIARILDEKRLKRFVEICFEQGIEPVVEVFSEKDLVRAAKTKTRFIAVNARDLETFDVNVKRACKIMNKIPERFIRLGFSGIRSAEEVLQYKKAGARGVLIGTALMKTPIESEKTGNISKFIGGIRD